MQALVGVRPAHWPVSSRLRHGSCGTGRSFSTRRSAIASCRLAASLAQLPRTFADVAPGSRCVSHRAVLWLICRPVGFHPISQQLPLSPFPVMLTLGRAASSSPPPRSSSSPESDSRDVTLGRAASFSPRRLPAFVSWSDCVWRRNGNTDSWSHQQQGGNDDMATERTDGNGE